MRTATVLAPSVKELSQVAGRPIDREEASPEVILAEKPFENPQPKTSIFHLVIKCLADAAVRGPLRYLERFINNEFLRVLFYRPLTESARKILEIALGNYLENKETTKKDFVTAVIRALEHVPATAIIEPNFFESAVPRVFAGLGNMGLRFVSRLGFYGVGAIDKEGLGLNHLLDDFLSRSAIRLVRSISNNPLVLVVEQALINLNLHIVKPLGRSFPGFPDLFEAKQEAAKITEFEARLAI